MIQEGKARLKPFRSISKQNERLKIVQGVGVGVSAKVQGAIAV